jgi:NADH-quinone oxidoreductase subunit B
VLDGLKLLQDKIGNQVHRAGHKGSAPHDLLAGTYGLTK